MVEDDEGPVLQQARRCAERGWRPFPCEYQGKRPAVGIKWGTATASASVPGMLKLWFGRDPVNIGIPAKGSGLTFLDDDTGTADGMEKLCEAYGREIPKTYRVRTSKGWHWYFGTPPGVEIANAGQGSYLKDEFGFDIRGNRGGKENAGGYVIGAGSVHESGTVYVAEDPDAAVAPLPDWLLELLLANGSDKREAGETPVGETDRDRRYTMDQAINWVKQYAVDPLRSATKGGRNNALNTAAVVIGHFVPTFFSEEYAWERLEEEANRLELDSREIEPTIRSGLRTGMSQPYTLVEVNPFASESDSSATKPDSFEGDVAKKLRELRIVDEARRRLAREHRAHRPKIAEGVLNDLDIIAEPVMLMGSLIPDRAVGFLAGRSGAYKSFLATSWACCVATGRSWLSRSEFAVSRPLKVLYVAAEGAGGAAGRIRAWEAANRASRLDKLLLYPRPIHLNDPAQVDELTEYVVEHGVEFLVIDTYHRSAPGTEENSSTDFGVVFEAVAGLRDEHDCSSLFVDHTGAQKAGNPRGTSAKRDDADYVLSSTYQGEEATADTQRELFVTKLKDEDTRGRWLIRLNAVEGQHFPVVSLGTAGDGSPFADLGEWWTVENCPEIPVDTLEAIEKEVAKRRGKGREAARWIWRLLASIDDEAGLTNPEIRRMLGAAPPSEKLSEETVKRGLVVLVAAGCVWRDNTKFGLEMHS